MSNKLVTKIAWIIFWVAVGYTWRMVQIGG